MNFIRDWNDFWYRPISARPLGLFRIVFGFIVICWCALIAPDLFTWYSNTGVAPLSSLAHRSEMRTGLDMLRSVSSPVVLVAAFVFTCLCAVAFTAGFCTRAASILLFICITSFNHRNSMILNSGDTMMRLCLFYMMFAPSGAALSVDRWLQVRDGDARADEVPMIEPWAQRLIQLQVSLVYLSTFLWKIFGNQWLNGTAVYYPLHIGELTRFPLPWLADNLLMINIMTYGTLTMECMLATLIWIPRFRKYALLGGILLHTGIEYALNIPLFAAIMVSTYITFFPDRWAVRVIDRASRFLRRRAISDEPAPTLAPDFVSEGLGSHPADGSLAET